MLKTLIKILIKILFFLKKCLSWFKVLVLKTNVIDSPWVRIPLSSFKKIMELVLMNHLKELKWRFIYLGFAFILTFLISYYYVNELLFLIMNPFQNHIPLFIYTNLIDGLSSTLKIDLI